ncbi:ABC transporter permease subunit [Paraburkholderia caballeronis]|uniref:ABC transporter permease subunit n=1 Tax=Paraburkholderia caballeronis TaxID=416943 RepID=UPI001064F424|nr:ABC transporter permease subunit [Paraburkholderia caballeronis]TDV15712.1 taurine transport system permease protein [Paraburkholderia caballeronis]TDV17967.1 taurine transport system permease protein [Paraburkholderia caballeronis]TDV26419.1 taurine transport system permease protein [Paraburkholderia caballeronis]
MAATQGRTLRRAGAEEGAGSQAGQHASDSRLKKRRRNSTGLPGEGETWTISVATTLVLFAMWWCATHFGWIKPLFLPSPAATFDAFISAVKGDTQGNTPLVEHVEISVIRVLAAFVLAVVTAVPIGIAMGTSRIARGIADPLIEFYRPLPPLAYLPLIVIWLGIDESAKITLIFLACFAPLAMSAKAGVRSVAIEQINAARSLGATRWQLLTLVVLPAALPEILTGMRIAIGFGWTTLVAAEMVAATAGLGQMVLNASNFLRTDIVIMGIIVIGILAYCFDLLMRRVETALTPWKGKM